MRIDARNDCKLHAVCYMFFEVRSSGAQDKGAGRPKQGTLDHDMKFNGCSSARVTSFRL